MLKLNNNVYLNEAMLLAEMLEDKLSYMLKVTSGMQLGYDLHKWASTITEIRIEMEQYENDS